MKEITKEELISGLAGGVSRTTDFKAKLTEYHGGRIGTEYLLTSDIAREFVERRYEVAVECKNRHLVSALTERPNHGLERLRGKRTDVVLRDSIWPLALIEVKIGVRTLRDIKGDISKICSTMSRLKPQYISKVLGASVFETHICNKKLHWQKQLLDAAKAKEQKIQHELLIFAASHPAFSFEWVTLHDVDGGITETDIEDEDDGQKALGAQGHATRYHAVIIQSKVPHNPPYAGVSGSAVAP